MCRGKGVKGSMRRDDFEDNLFLISSGKRRKWLCMDKKDGGKRLKERMLINAKWE